MVKKIQLLFGQYVDKFAHIGISSLLYLFIYAITKDEVISILLTFFIGLLKEILDYIFYHAEILDIIANIFGITTTVFLVKIILKGV